MHPCGKRPARESCGSHCRPISQHGKVVEVTAGLFPSHQGTRRMGTAKRRPNAASVFTCAAKKILAVCSAQCAAAKPSQCAVSGALQRSPCSVQCAVRKLEFR
eukprot:360723-Chlamydomonas_euryale.AAC.4